MEQNRLGSFYTYSLAAVAIGYVVLLMVLLKGEPDERHVGRVSEGRAVALATNPGVNSAYQRGFRPAGKTKVECQPSAPTWSCDVSGFVNSQGARCSVQVQIDTSVRRPTAVAGGYRCLSGTPPQ